MTSRSKTCTRTSVHSALTTQHLSMFLPHMPKALADPNWANAMQVEYNALHENKTWELVPRPTDRPIIRCMLLFRHKFKSYGTLEKYKARLVIHGNSQTMGIVIIHLEGVWDCVLNLIFKLLRFKNADNQFLVFGMAF